MSKIGSAVDIYYGEEYVCTTHTNHGKKSLKACIEVFIEVSKGDKFGYYEIQKRMEENRGNTFDENKFRAVYAEN